MSEELEITRIADVVAMSTDTRWLVRGLWSRVAVGVIGGVPKTCKSWLGLDLATSVASGTPCLGRFAVEDQGPALVYLAEDALPIVRERVAGICAERGLDFPSLDLHAITAPSLRLDDEVDQKRLRATLDRLRPKLLLLDPLVRLHACDENSSQEIAGLLGYLRELQRRHHVAVVLVHHLGKKTHGQIGQGLRGSGDLHAWGDDNAYLTRKGEDLLLTLEHRSAPATPPVMLRLVALDDGTQTHLQVLDPQGQDTASCPVNSVPLHEQILGLLIDAGRSLPRTVIRTKLRINNKRLGDALAELERRGLIHRTPDGYATT
jgi:hypothetical protein